MALQVNMCVNGFMKRVHDFLFEIGYAVGMKCVCEMAGCVCKKDSVM